MMCNSLLPLHVIHRISKHTLPGLCTSCKLSFTQAGPSSYRLPNMLAQPGPPCSAWHSMAHDQTWSNMSSSQSGPFRSNLKPQQHRDRGCIIYFLSLVVRIEELAAIVLVGGQISSIGHVRQLRLRCSFDKQRACGCRTKQTQPKGVHVRQTGY